MLGKSPDNNLVVEERNNDIILGLVTRLFNEKYRTLLIPHTGEERPYPETSRLRFEIFLGNKRTPLPDGTFKEQVPFDGDIYNHQINQARIIQRFAFHDIGSEKLSEIGLLDSGDFTSNDFSMIKVTALGHDIGEVEEGDEVKLFEHSGTSNVESEMRTFNRLIETIVANPELVDEMKEAYKVCCNKEHRLYKLFKLYEKYNYITGAIFAYSNKENIEKHIALIVRTFINHIPTLLDYARKGVPSTIKFLDYYAKNIEELFAYVVSNFSKDTSYPEHLEGILDKEREIQEFKKAEEQFRAYLSKIS